MTSPNPSWLKVHEGAAPLILAFPHTGLDIPDDIAVGLVSGWCARRDADWWVDLLYDFVGSLGATTVRTTISRTDEIEARRQRYFDPYHQGLTDQIRRLQSRHRRVLLYDAHSIRSEIPRLFEDLLPHFNIGTHNGASCDTALVGRIEAICGGGEHTCVTNGRFKGGWTTRHYGRPQAGVHAIQMELACRGYMDEPIGAPTPENWPTPFEPARAAPLRAVLKDVLEACLAFAST